MKVDSSKLADLVTHELDKWGEETGVHAKFKREASRVNYKKSIFKEKL